MPGDGGELAVRRFERHECALSAGIRVSAAHRPYVRHAKSALSSSGTLAGRIVDWSKGGLGLEVAAFVPVGCELDVEIIDPESLAGSHITDTLASAKVRVRRVEMIDREPRYYLASSMAQEEDETGELLAMLSKLSQDESKPEGEGNGSAGV